MIKGTAIAKTAGARKAARPQWIEPMKAVLVDAPFDRAGWMFEDKYDGIRTLCFILNGKVRLFSRNQKEMTIRYPELSEMPKWIAAKEAILDGEIIVLNKHGHASFQELQARFGLKNIDEIERLSKTQKIVLYVFDLLYLDGYDIMGATLLDRKTLLTKIVQERTIFQVAPHTLGDGLKRFHAAERKHLEGIMAKNGASHYEQRRSREWLKIKTTMRQEAIIVGYTKPQGSREYFGALHLGLYDGKQLVSVGKVGTGFDRARLKEIYDAMQPFRIDKAPFDREFRKSSRWRGRIEDIQWLKPKLVCEVKFSERTGEGSFRHPVFEGLRFDKKASECTFEQAQHV
ncbi:MAG: non-homologous end-joining DNA ligase [Bacteroidota bacterium]|nr:non-homologous end-joining DNA ligase [Bacteroidota bacterium]MDP4233147.1 non-homologous end-joining DNA ligase [Bacteroidota bacterium]MDP4241708.1 non-homologous end-joining DNA ligase [Bacteroidota bacterium]MDP4287366.1 non-homologous end-joining DNA ligase [Bacteroidota bacterium]